MISNVVKVTIHHIEVTGLIYTHLHTHSYLIYPLLYSLFLFYILYLYSLPLFSISILYLYFHLFLSISLL